MGILAFVALLICGFLYLAYENYELKGEIQYLQPAVTDSDFPVSKQSHVLKALKNNFDLLQQSYVRAENRKERVKKRYGKDSKQYQKAVKHEKIIKASADSAFQTYQAEWRRERTVNKEGQQV